MLFRFVFLKIFLFICLTSYLDAGVRVRKSRNPRRDYSYYISSKVRKTSKTRLFIAFPTVRGGNSHIFRYFKRLAERRGWILVSPNFLPENPAKRPRYRLIPRRIIGSALEFVKLVKSDFKKYNLHRKVILYGFSGGGRDAIGMAMLYPEMVKLAIVQCPGGLHSYWNKLPTAPGAGGIKRRAGQVPIFLSCGQRDSTRMAEMKKTVRAYRQKFGRNPRKVKYYRRQGHRVTRRQMKDTIRFIKKYSR